MTKDTDIPIAKSPVDYIFRWLGVQYCGMRSQLSPIQYAPTEADEATIAPSEEPEEEGPTISDQPVCRECGGIMVRSGTCHRCPECGETDGCS